MSRSCLNCLGCLAASRYGLWWVAMAFFASRDMKVQVSHWVTRGEMWKGKKGEERWGNANMPNICQICHIYCIYWSYTVSFALFLCIGISRPLLACDQRKSTVKIRWVFCDMSLHEQRSRCRWALCPMWGGLFLSFFWLLNGKSDRWCLCSTLNMLWYA